MELKDGVALAVTALKDAIETAANEKNNQAEPAQSTYAGPVTVGKWVLGLDPLSRADILTCMTGLLKHHIVSDDNAEVPRFEFLDNGALHLPMFNIAERISYYIADTITPGIMVQEMDSEGEILNVTIGMKMGNSGSLAEFKQMFTATFNQDGNFMLGESAQYGKMLGIALSPELEDLPGVTEMETEDGSTAGIYFVNS